MAENDRQFGVEFKATDNTQAAFKSLGANVEKTSKSAGMLTASFEDLAKTALSVFAASEIISFLKESGQAALDDEKALVILQGAIRSVGASLASTLPQVQAFAEAQVHFGQQVSQTEEALSTLIRVTGDANQAMALSSLATDLASSGFGDYNSNVEALSNLFNGRFRQAAAAFNIQLGDNATAADVLDKVMARVTTTGEEMAQTQTGQLKEMSARWQEFKGYLGTFITWFAGNFADAMIRTGTAIGDNAQGVFHTLAAVGAAATGSFGAAKTELETAGSFFKKAFNDFDNSVKTGDILLARIQETSTKNELAKTRASLAASAAADAAAKAQTDLAAKLKSSFQDVSRAVVSALQSQQKAIDDLHQSIDDIDSKLNDDLSKSNEKYQQDVVQVARQAQSRLKTINDQIAQEKSSRSAGFRDRIADLETQAAAEQSIITRAGGQVSDLKAQLAEDDLQQAQDAHAKEVAQLQKNAADAKAAAQAEIDARTKNIKDISTVVNDKGFYTKAATEGTTFAGTIGAGGVQQILNFNFNSTVAGDAGIQKIITDTVAQLNRTATLHGVAGK